MRKLITAILVTYALAYALGQLPNGGASLLLIIACTAFASFVLGHAIGRRERIKTVERSTARLELAKG